MLPARASLYFKADDTDPKIFHIYNHLLINEHHYYPLDGHQKTLLINEAKKHLLKFNIELLSYTVLDNHYHLMIRCHPEQLTPEQAAMGYDKFHHNEPGTTPAEHPVAYSTAERSNNFSHYIGELQSAFSKKLKKCSCRLGGTVWQRRFGSDLVQNSSYLWICWKYIEMNPVRAGIATHPKNYDYCSFGEWEKTGQHPFADPFMEVILELLPDSDQDIEVFRSYAYLEFERMTMAEKFDAILKKTGIEDQGLREQLKEIREELDKFTFSLGNAYRPRRKKHFIGDDDFIEAQCKLYKEFSNAP